MLYEIPDGFALRVIERSVYWSEDLDPDRVGVQVFVPQPFGCSGVPKYVFGFSELVRFAFFSYESVAGSVVVPAVQSVYDSRRSAGSGTRVVHDYEKLLVNSRSPFLWGRIDFFPRKHRCSDYSITLR